MEFGLLIAFLAGVLVFMDAKRIGLKGSEPFTWGGAVFLLLIIALPAYLIKRPSYKNKFSPSNDKIADIERLAALKDKGILTEEEFLNQKKILLGSV